MNRYLTMTLLGCCAVYSVRSLPTFHRCMLPPSLDPFLQFQHHIRSEAAMSLRLHGATSRKTDIFILVAVRT
jgi:hypothetical protein